MCDPGTRILIPILDRQALEAIVCTVILQRFLEHPEDLARERRCGRISAFEEIRAVGEDSVDMCHESFWDVLARRFHFLRRAGISSTCR